MTPVLAGLGLGFSLIIAIGAQNVFVLRQGLRREHVLLVAAICAVSDALLIAAGVSRIGAATAAVPWLVPTVRWLGAGFLVGYGLLAGRRAVRPSGYGLVTDGPGEGVLSAGSGATATIARAESPARVALTCLALTWLNPHVYLDTVFLLGSVGAAHGEQRWWFATGAVVASVSWFFGLGYGARLLRPWLASPASWRVVDAAVALVMVGLGVSLAV